MNLRSLVLLLSVIATVTFVPSGASGQSPQPLGLKPIEDFSFLAGRWRAEPAFQEAVGPRPRFVNILEITASPAEVRINRGHPPVETYRLDGTVTDLGNGYVTSAVPVGDGIMLTTRRVSRPSVMTHADLYRVADDVLTVDSRRSQTQPDGTLIQMQSTRVTIVYRRTR